MPDYKSWVSTNGDLNSAASWSPSGTPVVSDHWFFGDSSQVDVISNLSALLGGSRIWVQKTYEGNVGANGNPLVVYFNTMVHQGSGSIYLNRTAYPTSFLTVDSPNLIDAMTITAVGATVPGDEELFVLCLSGGVEFLNDFGILYGLHVGSPQATVTIGSGSGIIRHYSQNSGTVTTKRPLGGTSASPRGRALVAGGTLTYDVSATTAWNDLEITGGRVVYNGTGALSNCIVSSGILDMTEDYRAKTISFLLLYPGATFLTHPAITVTQLIDARQSPPRQFINGVEY